MLCSPADECVTRTIQSRVKRLCEDGGENIDKTLFKTQLNKLFMDKPWETAQQGGNVNMRS